MDLVIKSLLYKDYMEIIKEYRNEEDRGAGLDYGLLMVSSRNGS